MATFQVIKSLCIRQQNFRIPDNGIQFADMSRTRTQPGIHGMIEFFYNIPGNRIIGSGGVYPTTPIGVLVIVFSGLVFLLCPGQSLPNTSEDVRLGKEWVRRGKSCGWKYQ